MVAEDLYFDGEKYLSVRSASKITKYAADYIGQLCRAGKLRARRVGRGWYIEEKSLSEHLAAYSALSKNHEFRNQKDAEAPVVQPHSEIGRELMRREIDARVSEEIKSLSKPVTESVLLQVLPELTKKPKEKKEPLVMRASTPGGFSLAKKKENNEVNNKSEKQFEKNFLDTPSLSLSSPLHSKLAALALSVGIVFFGYQLEAKQVRFADIAALPMSVATEISERMQSVRSADMRALSLASAGDGIAALIRRAGEKIADALFGDIEYKLIVTNPNEEKNEALKDEVENLKKRLASFERTGGTLASGGSAPAVIERVVSVVSGVSESDLNVLENSLKSELYRVAAVSASANNATYQAVALTNRIDQLFNTAISGATITNSTFAGSIAATSLSASGDGSVGGALTVTGTITSSSGTTTVQRLSIAGLDCSALANAGKLTVDSTGGVVCQDDLGGGGGASSDFTYSSVEADNSFGLVYMATTSNQLLLGGTSTSSSAQLEVIGDQYVSGNLGIGTTTPFVPMAVVGDAYVGGNITATGTVNVNKNAVTPALFGASDSQTGLKLIGIDSTQNTVLMHAYGNANNALAAYSAQGTAALPTASVLDDTFMRVGGGGYTGSTYVFRSEIDFKAGEDWTPSANGSYILFQTTANGGTSRTEKMRLSPSGNLGIGTTTPWGQLSVNPNGITGPAFVVGSSTATKFVVTNGGNVGIGTTNPSVDLHIAGTGNIRLENSNSGILSTGNLYLDTQGGGNFNVRTAAALSGTTKLQVTNAGGLVLGNGYINTDPGAGNMILEGTLGVGTNSTDYPLDVTGDARFTGGLGLGTSVPGLDGRLVLSQDIVLEGNPASGSYLTVSGAPTANNMGVNYAPTISANSTYSRGFVAAETVATGVTVGNRSGIYIYNPVLNGTGAITNNYGIYLENQTSGGTDYAIYSAGGQSYFGGNVGIGTTSPYAKLSVVGPVVAEYFHATSTTAVSSFSGYVGIGTTTPQYPLVIANSSGRFYLRNTEDSDTSFLGGVLFSTAGGKLTLYSADSVGTGQRTAMFDYENKRFSVGELLNGNSPEATLHVKNNSATVPVFQVDVSNDPLFVINSITGGFGVGIGTTSPHARLAIHGTPSWYKDTLFSIASSTEDFATSTHFTVLANGNIGIGTTSPMAALALNSGQIGAPGGSASAPGFAFTSNLGTGLNSPAANDIRISSGGTDNFRSAGNVEYLLGNTTIGSISTVPTNKLSVLGSASIGANFNTAAPTNGLIIEGNVGIGTTSPYATLSIVGSSSPLTVFAQSTSTTANGLLASFLHGFATTTASSSPREFGSVRDFHMSVKGSVSNATSLDGAYNVHVSGRYAYVTTAVADSLTVVDISNPASPVVVGSVTDTVVLNGLRPVFVSGRYAYVGAENGNRLVVVDISNPVLPVIVGSVNDSVNLSAPRSLYVSGRYAYVASNGTNRLTIVDVSNPASPFVIGSLSDSSNFLGISGIHVVGKYAYVAALSANRLAIVDISNPVSPVVVGSVTDSTNLNQAISVFVSGRYAYVANAAGNRLTIIDVSSPTAPAVTGTVGDATTLSGAFSVQVSGNYAYVAARTGNSITVVNVSVPSAPFIVGSIADSTNLSDVRSVYISGRYAYATAFTGDRLTIIDLAGLDMPTALIGNLQSSSITAWDNVDVGNNLNVRSGLNVGNGGVLSNGAGQFSIFATTSLTSVPALSALVTDSNTSSVVNALSLTHYATATAASGIGTGILFNAPTLCSLANCAGATTTATSTAQIASFLTSVATTSPASVLTFSTKGSAVGLTERMRIDSSGNVGIGTTSPYAKTTIWGAATGKVLEVVGSASTTFLSVAADGFGTTTLSGLTVSASATSTSNVGFNLSAGCYAVNNVCVGAGGTSQWTTSGSNIYYNTGNVGIGTLTPSALLSVNATSTPTVTKTSSSDFSVSGSSVTSGVATTSNQITLNFATTTNIGNGTVTTGPTLSSTPGEGFHAIKRPDGKFLMIVGGSGATTMVYDPVANSTVAGPTLLGNAYIGSQSVERPNGTFLITRPGTGANDIYDPVANTVSAGPASTASSGQGSHFIRRPDGKYLLINGGGFATTEIYDPVANTITTGPSLATGNASLGSHSLKRPDGKFLLINGGGTATTNIYDPVANTFAVGPTIVGTAANTASTGANSIQRPDGKFLVIQGGNSTNTSVYDPVANTFVAGPALASGVANGYAHSLQRPDGKFLIVNASGASPSPSNIYDPVANTFAAGPTLTSGTITLGSSSLQRPDGKYLIVHGSSGASTTLYDPGWVVSGSYESEDLNITSLNQSSILRYQTNGEGRIEVAIKTASTQANLTGATYATTTNNSLIRPATTSPQWAKVRVTFTRTIPTMSQPDSVRDETNTWLGVNDTKYQRSFAQPILYSFTIENNTIFRKENADFGSGFATSTSLSTATTSGPTLSNLIGGDGGLTLPYSIGFLHSSTTLNSTLGLFATGTPTTTVSLGTGAHAIERPDGNFLIVHGGAKTSTSVYDPIANTMIAGPTFPSGTIPTTETFSFQRPDGKFVIASSTLAIYDPIANTITAGLGIGFAPGTGSHAIQRPDGKFVLFYGGGSASTTVYDAVSNSTTTGPTMVASRTTNTGAFSIRRPDGTFLVVGGGGSSGTSIYDPVTNTFIAGPSLASGTAAAGAHAIERPDGKFLIIDGNDGTNTNIYDPVANTMTAGTALTNIAGGGSHSFQRPDGNFIIVSATNRALTTLYNPMANTMTAGPALDFAANSGTFSIQRPDGKFVLFYGNGSATSTLYDAGWLMDGFYESEFINDTTLDSTSVLSWQGNADSFKQGAVSFRVRTASSEAGLATTTWRTIEKNGGLINPVSGDTWMQIRVDMKRTIPKQPNTFRNVWSGSRSGGAFVLYNRLPLEAGAGIPSVNQAEVFIKPVITSYRVFKANNPDIATFSLNGENLFRFSSAGDAFVREGGSWNSGGADVAEYFPTNDATLEAGDLVTISQDAAAGLIAKTGQSYDDNLLGIITTTPGVKLGIDVDGGTAEKQPVALVGRVPVKVSLENGAIKKGDYLTSSSKPGVAMRATDPGRVVAIALEDFNEDNIDATTGIGTVLVYVNPHTYLGTTFWDRVGSKFSRWGYLVQRSLAELGITVTDEGNVGIGTTTPVSKLSVAGGNLSVFGGALCVEGDSGRCAGELSPGTIYARSITLSAQSLATSYEMKDAETEEGDIVAISLEAGSAGNKLERATTAARVIGVVAGADALLLGERGFSESASSSKPVVASGRVMMKVSTEHGALRAGDRISIGSVPGVGVKASTSGMTLGIALEDFDGGLTVPLAVGTSTEVGTTTQSESGTSGGNSATGRILVFVNLSYAVLDSDIAATAQATSTAATNAWMVDQQGGLTSVNFFGDINLQGNKLLDVSRISGYQGKWSIDEEGKFVGESLSVKGTVKVGSPERRTGVTLFDEVTGEPYCLSLAAGAVKTVAGECPNTGVSGNVSTGGLSAEEISATATPESTAETATSAPSIDEGAAESPAETASSTPPIDEGAVAGSEETATTTVPTP